MSHCYRCYGRVVLDPGAAGGVKKLLAEVYTQLDISNPLLSKRILDARDMLDMALYQAIPMEDLGG